MPYKAGASALAIRPKVLARLQKKYEDKKKAAPSMVPDLFGTYVNDLLELYLDKEEFLAKIAPHLDYKGKGEDVLYIKDHRKGKTAEIYIKDMELWCDLDRSHDCDHIHFAFAIPEVARLPIKRPR